MLNDRTPAGSGCFIRPPELQRFPKQVVKGITALSIFELIREPRKSNPGLFVRAFEIALNLTCAVVLPGAAVLVARKQLIYRWKRQHCPRIEPNPPAARFFQNPQP